MLADWSEARKATVGTRYTKPSTQCNLSIALRRSAPSELWPTFQPTRQRGRSILIGVGQSRHQCWNHEREPGCSMGLRAPMQCTVLALERGLRIIHPLATNGRMNCSSVSLVEECPRGHGWLQPTALCAGPTSRPSIGSDYSSKSRSQRARRLMQGVGRHHK